MTRRSRAYIALASSLALHVALLVLVRLPGARKHAPAARKAMPITLVMPKRAGQRGASPPIAQQGAPPVQQLAPPSQQLAKRRAAKGRAPHAIARGGAIAREESPDGDSPLKRGASPRGDETPLRQEGPRGLSLDLDPGKLLAAGPAPIGVGSGSAGEELPERGGGNVDPASELRFKGFLERLEDAVGRTWIGKVDREALALDPTGHFSHEDRTTLVGFVLEPSGAVRRASVMRSCGVPHLDDAALHAVRAAGPFPNVPHAMFEGVGERRFLFKFTLLAAGKMQATRLRFQ